MMLLALNAVSLLVKPRAPAASVPVSIAMAFPIATTGLSESQRRSLVNNPDTSVFLAVPTKPATDADILKCQASFAEALMTTGAKSKAEEGPAKPAAMKNPSTAKPQGRKRKAFVRFVNEVTEPSTKGQTKGRGAKRKAIFRFVQGACAVEPLE